MTEADVDAQMKRYWARKERLIPQDILDLMEDESRGFEDGTADNPVDATEFLSYLDLSFAEEFLRSLYRREPIFPAVAVVKALLLTDLKKKRFYTKLRRDLLSHPEEAEKLGFPRKDGEVLIPSEKTLWHFDNVRMGSRWNEFFRLLRNDVVKEGRKLGLNIGERTMEDMRMLGIRVKENWMDGGYDDYPNIAWLGVHGIEAHHPIHENWVINDSGSEKHLRKLN